MWVAEVAGRDDSDEKRIYAYNLDTGARIPENDYKTLNENWNEGSDTGIESPDNDRPRGIWSDGENMSHRKDPGDMKILAYLMPPASGTTGGSDFFFSEDSTLKDLQLSGATLTPAFSADNLYYTALVDHAVNIATVTATPNDAGAAVDILSGVLGTTRSEAVRGPQVSFEEVDNIIAIDVTAESRTAQSTYIIEVTKAEAPPTSGGPLLVFQSASVGDNPSASSSSSVAVLGEWKSQFIFAEPLLDGGVRFVFAVPAAEEFGIEETADLLGETWKPLPEDEVKILRESSGAGPERLTIILPKAAGKQRFLRLRPLTTSRP